MFGHSVQLHDRGRIEHGHLLEAFDRQLLWSVAGIDKNHWRCELLRLAALEVDLKRLWGDKTGLAYQQIQPLRRFDTALKGVASALDHALFTFAHGLHIDRNGASAYAVISSTPCQVGDARAGDHRFCGGTAHVDTDTA